MILNVSRRDRPTPLRSGIICCLLGLRALELPHASRIPGTDAAILQRFVRTAGKRGLPSRLPHIKNYREGQEVVCMKMIFRARQCYFEVGSAAACSAATLEVLVISSGLCHTGFLNPGFRLNSVGVAPTCLRNTRVR